MYTSTCLADAGEYIKDITDGIKDKISFKPDLDNTYIELFDRISSSKGGQQEGWAYCLTPGELELLSECIYSDYCKGKSAKEVQALISVFCKSNNKKHIDVLFKGWQNFYDEPKYAAIFHMIYEIEAYRSYFKEEYDINLKELSEAVENNDSVGYFNELASKLSDGSYDNYAARLEECGLVKGTKLFQECTAMYALVCDGRTYMKMGVEVVKEFMINLDTDNRVKMMQNMLRVLDSYQLKMFVSLMPMFREYAGEHGSSTYELVIAPLSKNEKEKYVLWQNQYLIYEVLGDGERSDFWMSYADRSVVEKHNLANIIFLKFSGFTVIEFEKGEAAYFFNNQYMRDNVYPVINDMEQEEDIEKWIHDNTEWSLDKTHKDHWRKVHFGTWQLDVKSYMSRNLVGVQN